MLELWDSVNERDLRLPVWIGVRAILSMSEAASDIVKSQRKQLQFAVVRESDRDSGKQDGSFQQRNEHRLHRDLAMHVWLQRAGLCNLHKQRCLLVGNCKLWIPELELVGYLCWTSSDS